MESQDLTSEESLALAVDRLVAKEPRFAPVLTHHGYPSLRRVEPGLRSLLRIVTDQLISLKAGEAIWRRIETHLGEVGPGTVMAASIAELKALGLSTSKALTFHAAATAAGNGLLDRGLVNLSDEQAARALCTIRGIGPWTADIYLLTAMGRADAWPAGDLALQVAVQHLFGLDSRPDSKAMRDIAVAWMPYRSAAARLLWSHYRGLKQMPQHPI